MISQNSKFTVDAPIRNVDGTIVFADPSRIVSTALENTITFSSGVAGTPGAEYTFSGTLDPNFSSDGLVLTDGNRLSTGMQALNQPVTIAQGATATITGPIRTSSQITLSNNSTLILDTNVPLSSPLSVGTNCTVKLLQPLKLLSGVQLSTATLQTLLLNGSSLEVEGVFSPINAITGPGNLLLRNDSYSLATDLNLYAMAGLNGGGSTITMQPSTVIRTGAGFYEFDNVTIRDLGGSSTFAVNQSGTLLLSNVTLELKDDLILSGQGTWTFLESNCKIIPNGHKIFLDNGTTWIVDNCTLFYQPSNPLETNPIVIQNSGSGAGILQFLGSGQIQSTNQGLDILDKIFVTGNSLTLSKALELSTNSTLTFGNATPSIAKSATLNGDGFEIRMPPGGSSSQLLILQPNVSLTTTSIFFKDFAPSAIWPLPPNSSLTFGNNTTLGFSTNTEPTAAMYFSSNTTIDGNGKTLTLSAPGIINVLSNSRLTIRNSRVLISNADAFSCQSNTAEVVFQDCIIWISKTGLQLSTGSYKTVGKVEFFGSDQTTVGTMADLVVSTSGSFTVSSFSSMIVNRGIKLIYKASPALDGINTKATRRHFKLADPSSSLVLDGATLVSTLTAFALDYGKLIVRDTVPFLIETASPAEIGTALEVEILSGATLDVKGPLRQVTTTFP